MQMGNTMGVLSRLVHCSVNDVPTNVDAKTGLVNKRATVQVNLHQTGRGDFVEEQTERIDQIVPLWARNASRDMVENIVIPAVPGAPSR